MGWLGSLIYHMTRISRRARALKKTFGRSHVLGSIRADMSGAIKTCTALVVSTHYISIGISDFLHFL